MRICVVGCGAIGSLFAACLAALDDVEVWVFDVSQAQVRAINDEGLRCSGGKAGMHGIRARCDGAQIPPPVNPVGWSASAGSPACLSAPQTAWSLT